MTVEPKRQDKEDGTKPESELASPNKFNKASQIRDHGEPAEHSGDNAAAPGRARADSVEIEWIGRILDERYQVIEMIGEGGMGAVFLAKHLKLQKEVAIKVIRPEFAGDGEIAARFAREAMATARFEHPHVASAIDFGTLPEGGAYFVMQLVKGKSLTELLAAEGRIPWIRAVEIGAQIADALSAAAAQGIVHRDLKPDNIIIERREDGTDLVKILDFGIARHTRESIPAPAPDGSPIRRKLTREGAIVGTPGYMSPEQAMGDKADFSADLYALGVVIWESITGRHLWDAEDFSSMVMRQLTEPVPSLRDTFPQEDIHEELDRLLSQLLAATSKDRLKQAGTVRDLLRQLVVASTDPSAARAILQERITGTHPEPAAEQDAEIDASNAAAAPGAPAEAAPAAIKVEPGPTPPGQPVAFDPQVVMNIQTAPTLIVANPPVMPATLEPQAVPSPGAPVTPARPATAVSTPAAASSPRKKPGAVAAIFVAVLMSMIFLLSVVDTLIFQGKDLGRFWKMLYRAMPEAADQGAQEIERRVPGSTVALSKIVADTQQGFARLEKNATELGKSIPEIAGSETRSQVESRPPDLVEPIREIPPKLVKYLKPLIDGKQYKIRARAAEKVLAYQPASEVPDYLLAAARLQKAQTCSAKKDAVIGLGKIGDARALPMLRRLAEWPQTGCGPRRARDCLGCLRPDLEASIQRLGGK